MYLLEKQYPKLLLIDSEFNPFQKALLTALYSRISITIYIRLVRMMTASYLFSRYWLKLALRAEHTLIVVIFLPWFEMDNSTTTIVVIISVRVGNNVVQGSESDAGGIIQFTNDLETAAAREQEVGEKGESKQEESSGSDEEREYGTEVL